MEDLVSLNDQLLKVGRESNFSGYDPFDSLNSKLFRATPFFRNSWLRLIWLQFGKRSFFNFRPVLLVPKTRNPKGVGLFILGLLEDYKRTADPLFLEEALELSEWLLTQRSDREIWKYSCWGYNFDWQARAFYVPASKPNIVTTYYVARALYSVGEASSIQKYCEVALDAARFISSKLLTESKGRSFYAYIPGEKAFVHNASLWGAAWVTFAGTKFGDREAVNQALDVARNSVVEQAQNGCWVYGAQRHHQFIDSFHTGYNLEALSEIRDSCGVNEFNEAIEKGYRYYVDNFFTEEGTAKYYNNNIYPIDMHSFSQAIFTFLRVGGRKKDVELCDKVVRRAVELMFLPEKRQFVYQKHRWFTNKINYARWTQAWAYYGLAFYNRLKADLSNEKN